jgi:hypothetical protein
VVNRHVTPASVMFRRYSHAATSLARASCVVRTALELLSVGGDASAVRPAPGRWSPKELIGHLIDSAANNLRRFVQARWQDDLVFDGYAQDAWVAAQHYQEAPWPDLVALWREYNRHLAWVMTMVPPAVRYRVHARHNLHEIAWQPVPAGEPATLDYLMADYVAHLHHHLGQLQALLRSRAAV